MSKAIPNPTSAPPRVSLFNIQSENPSGMLWLRGRWLVFMWAFSDNMPWLSTVKHIFFQLNRVYFHDFSHILGVLASRPALVDDYPQTHHAEIASSALGYARSFRLQTPAFSHNHQIQQFVTFNYTPLSVCTCSPRQQSL